MGRAITYAGLDVREGTIAVALAEMGVGQVVRDVARAAGITKRVCPHLLRHTSAWLSAIQAARQRVWKTRFSKLTAIVMVSPGCRDIEKFGGAHSTRRTAAMASLNVGSDLRYQAATFGRSTFVASRAAPSAHAGDQ